MMQSLNIGGYTYKQVDDVLHGVHGYPIIDFRYDLLDKNENFKKTLTTIKNGEIKMSYTNDIKRTLTFSMIDDTSIDWLSDRIQPFYLLKMPDGGLCKWSLGIFLLSSPKRKEINGKIYRDVTAFDGLQILKDDKFDYRLTFAQGTNYMDAVKAVLSTTSITKINLPNVSSTLSIQRDWDCGTSKLDVINQLLADITMNNLYTDPNGYYTTFLKQLPTQRTINYTYSDDNQSIIAPELEEDLDLFSVPNKWVTSVSNGEISPLSNTYINSNPNSPTSTVNRGRSIVSYNTINWISDSTALANYNQLLSYQQSQIFGSLSFNTQLMPMHDFNDILKINYSALGISDVYEEIEWTLPLDISKLMNHLTKKSVQI